MVIFEHMIFCKAKTVKRASCKDTPILVTAENCKCQFRCVMRGASYITNLRNPCVASAFES